VKFPFPIRYSIPAALFILGLLVAVFSYRVESDRAGREIEEEIFVRAASFASRVSSLLEYHYGRGDVEGAELEVVLLGTAPDLKVGLVCDESDRIIHSTSYELKGRLLSQTPIRPMPDALARARASLAGQTGITDDRSSLQAAYPVRMPPLPGELRPSRTGALFLEFDLAFARQKASADSIRRSIAVASVITLLGLLVWLYFTLTMTRRVASLVEATARFAEGRAEAIAPLGGSDELAQVSRALNLMAQDIQAHHQKLLETNQSLQREANERKQAEWERSRMISIVESTSDFVGMCDSRGRAFYLNRAGRRLTGIGDRESIANLRVSDFHPRWALEIILGEGMPAVRREGQWEGETALLSRDGREIPVSQVIIAHRDEDGKIKFLSTVARDITERKRAEEVMRASEERFSKAFHASPVPMSIVSYEDGCYIDVNESFLRNSGYEREDVIGRTTVEIGIYAEAGERDRLRQMLEQHGRIRNAEVRRRIKSGDVRLALTSSEMISLNDQRCVLTATNDITERKQAEDALRESEERYRSLIEDASDAIVTLAADGTFTSINAAFEAITGWPRDEWTGRRFEPLVHPEDLPLVEETIQRALGGQKTQPIQMRVITRASKHALLEVIVTPQMREGKIIGVTGIGRDLTERLMLEEQLRQAQKMESIGRLAGGIAHDFNNILTVIEGHALLVKSRRIVPPEMSDSIKEIITAAERAASLTRQLLMFSRRQIIQPKDINLNEVVSNTINMLRRILGEDISMRIESSSALPLVRADVGMIEQILMNLAVNSRDAMPGGGRLIIGTTAVRIDEDYVSRNSEASVGEFVCLSMSDTGHGIAHEDLPNIFDPFFTTKEVGKGTGLGLATVYGIVKQHNGWIEVESGKGKGTAFRIYLPAITARVEEEETAGQEEVRPRGGDETILVVEDEPALRLLVQRVLEGYGYRVHGAGSGPAAIELWKERGDEIDLLLTDIVMPDGMTGRELAERLRAERPGLKVIFSSGYDPEIVCRDFPLQENRNFLQKPFSPTKLAQLVRDCLDERADHND
jgi:PAS domain S-box-containing protein